MSMNSNYLHAEDVHNLNAASLILPLIINLIYPKSVIDIGCGIGTWLSVAQKLGVEEVLGIDGDYVDRRLLLKYIDLDQFLPHDLNKPLNLFRKYDLAICLEVVEHLPESSSNLIVESIIKHADVVLFSAAIPGQCGQNHLNEQWPKYWANLFREYDYVFLDIIRPLIWENPKIDFWYKQNIFLIVKSNNTLLNKYSSSNLSTIHPELFNNVSKDLKKYHSKSLELKKELFLIQSGNKPFFFYLKLVLKYFYPRK